MAKSETTGGLPQAGRKRSIPKSNGVLRTDAELQELSNRVFGGRYLFTGRKTGKPASGIFFCTAHGTVFSQPLSTHLRGRVPRACPGCLHGKLSDSTGPRAYRPSPSRITDAELAERCRKAFKGRLKFTGRDPLNWKYGLYRCAHGTPLRQLIYANMKGAFPKGCQECAAEDRASRDRYILTPEKVMERAPKEFMDRYICTGRDCADGEDASFYCREHGISFEQKTYDFFRGVRGCLLCRRERGAFRNSVRNALLRIFPASEVAEDYAFGGCANLCILPFDFYIPALRLAVVLRYEHLSYPLEEWGGTDALAFRRRNLERRREYCEKNGINIVEADYLKRQKFEADLAVSVDKIKKDGLF